MMNSRGSAAGSSSVIGDIGKIICDVQLSWINVRNTADTNKSLALHLIFFRSQVSAGKNTVYLCQLSPLHINIDFPYSNDPAVSK